MANSNYTKVNTEQLNTLKSELKKNGSEITSSLRNYKKNLSSITSAGYLKGVSEDAINVSLDRIIKVNEQLSNYSEEVTKKINNIIEKVTEIDKEEEQKEDVYDQDPLNFEGKEDNNKPQNNEEKQEYSNHNNLNGSTLTASTPVRQGNKYNLTESQLNTLAYIAYREQGSVEGAKIELSLMANLYEKNKGKYSNVYDYVMHSGWFAHSTDHSAPSSAYLSAAKDVMSDGNRYLEANVVEHDCISDLSSVKVNGVPISRSDRSAYIPYQTKITNVYGATYTFVGFAPNGGDPFGYLS